MDSTMWTRRCRVNGRRSRRRRSSEAPGSIHLVGRARGPTILRGRLSLGCKHSLVKPCGVAQSRKNPRLRGAATDGVSGLTIRETLNILEHHGQGEPGGLSCRLAACRKQCCELIVTVELAKHLNHAKAEGTLGKGCMGDTSRFIGNQVGRLKAK